MSMVIDEATKKAMIGGMAQRVTEVIRWDSDLALDLCREILSECNLHTLCGEFNRIVQEQEKEAEAETNPFVT